MHSLLSDRFLKKFTGKRKNRQLSAPEESAGQAPETDADARDKLENSEKPEAAENGAGEQKQPGHSSAPEMENADEASQKNDTFP